MKTKKLGFFSKILNFCLVKEPDDRPTAADVLRHPFFANVKSSAPVRALIGEAKAEIVEVEEVCAVGHGRLIDCWFWFFIWLANRLIDFS